MKYALFLVFFLFSFLYFAQAAYRIDCPDSLRVLIQSHVSANKRVSDQELTQSLRNHLVSKGYAFAQVEISFGVIKVKLGHMGKTSISGNQHLSDKGILTYLNWETGQPFNYANFKSNAARLNANRFVEVDTKLAPVRGENGDILVNADFTVEDSSPIGFSLGFSNDGTSQSSGWRGKVGIQLWEPFGSADRLSLNFATDPGNFSQYNSYSLQYQLGSKKFKQVLYAGYSRSEYDNVISSSDINVAGDGYHVGYSAVYQLGDPGFKDFSLVFGATFLDTGNRIDFYGTPYGEESLALFLPRVGLRGSFGTFTEKGRAYWSIGLTSDFSTADNQDLSAQRVGVKNGFLVSDLSLTSYEPLDLGGVSGGLQTKLHWQYSDDPLPITLQKSLGGMSTIRGYEEREAFGDRGFSLNLEYRFDSVSSDFLGLDGRLQKLFFYDYGYLDSENSIASDFDSIDLSSVGVGLLGNFHASTDFSLHIGVPLSDTPSTQESDPRAHFGLNFRF